MIGRLIGVVVVLVIYILLVAGISTWCMTADYWSSLICGGLLFLVVTVIAIGILAALVN